MSATVTLATTTLYERVGHNRRDLKLTSATGVTPGIFLYIDSELVRVTGIGVATSVYTIVETQRGYGGTGASPHLGGSRVYIGSGDQFYSSDPVGMPETVIAVSPYINVRNGNVWLSQGDALPNGTGTRFWQLQTNTPSVGDLGVITRTLNPTTST